MTKIMPVYFDHNATTPMQACAREAMLPYLHGIYGNPSSVHRYGRLTRGAIEQAREQVAALVGAHSTQVVFTASGTEANNFTISGLTKGQAAAHIAISAIEHPSIREPAFALRNQHWEVDEIAVDDQGTLSPQALKSVIKHNTHFISVMTANNETGGIQDIQILADCAREAGIIFHTDASQAAGKIPLNFSTLGVHLMTLSSHKLYGPLGAGALIVDKHISLKPLLIGGSQEKGIRAGTHNVPAIVGFGAAAEYAAGRIKRRALKWAQLREQLEQALLQIPGIVIFAQDAQRLPNTVQFGIKDYHGEAMLMQLDRRGFAVSSGAACHSGTHEPSHVLLSMNVPPELALTAIRVSLGDDNSRNDIDRFIAVIREILGSSCHTNVNLMPNKVSSTAV